MTNAPDSWKRVEALLREDQRIQNEIDAIWKRLGQYPEPQGVWFDGHPNAFHNWTTTTTTTSTTTTSTTTASVGCYCSSANQYDITLSGITNGTCGNCSAVNGTHRASWALDVGTHCIWQTGTVATACVGYPDYIQLSILDDGSAVISCMGGLALYSAASFNCSGSTTFDRDSQTGGCNWPTTITVTKV